MTDLRAQDVVSPDIYYIHPDNIDRKVRKDKSGKRFGSLVAITPDFTRPKQKIRNMRYWCKCDCGTIFSAFASLISSGHTKTCGCAVRSRGGERLPRHNMFNSAEHTSWRGMKDRCNNINSIEYPNYGGRGISVCERWIRGFTYFYEDMGDRPPGASIERMDNSKGYSKENCKWATSAEQSINKRSNVMWTAFGVELCRQHWAKLIGVYPSSIDAYLRRGNSLEDYVVKRGALCRVQDYRHS